MRLRNWEKELRDLGIFLPIFLITHMARNPLMPGTNNIFIDADGMVANFDHLDSHHAKAIILSSYVRKTNIPLVTSNLAVGEAITVISQEAGLQKAISSGKELYYGNILIIDADRDQQLKALERFSHSTSKNVRFTDFVNMVIMDALHIDTIFSFDKHYLQAGYKLLSVPSSSFPSTSSR